MSSKGESTEPTCSAKPRTVIIGIGNEYRGDDAVGLIVARRLKTEAHQRLTVLEQDGDGAALIEAWKGAEEVIVIDAMSSGSSPGTILRLDANDRQLLKEVRFRLTHSFAVVEAIELARALNRLPTNLTICGIEGKSFEIGNGLSNEVARAADRLVTMIVEEAEYRKEAGRSAENRKQPTSPP